MKILITGGAGFIGSNFIYYLHDKYPEYEIVCLDILSYAANIKTLKPLFEKSNFKFIKGDIRDRDLINSLFAEENFDLVVNFAAESHVDRSIDDPSIFLETNILGTQNLMDAVLKYDVARFHQISTDEVYGELPLQKNGIKFSEKSPLSTSSPYSASKASADLLVEAYQKTYGLKAVISRSGNNFGPYQHPEKLIPLMITKALNNKKLPLYGKGENIRDWIHVDDHSAALDKIIHYGQNGEIYNIGAQNEKSNLEVVNLILEIMEKPKDLITFVEDRPGHDLRYALNTDKIMSELDWKPKTSFEKGIEDTIEWYLENKEWWQNMLNDDHKK